jgi:uncharacterized protein (UPF0332 family)
VGRWPKGERAVEYLLERSRLEPIATGDVGAMASVQIERATRRILTARAALELDDVDGAYAAAYDAYRMTAESLLVHQGLRATSGEGSHVTVEDAVSAQFAGDVAEFAKPTFERMRRTRHTAQYFDPSAAPITRADAEWAIDKAAGAITGVKALFSTSPPDRFV